MVIWSRFGKIAYKCDALLRLMARISPTGIIYKRPPSAPFGSKNWSFMTYLFRPSVDKLLLSVAVRVGAGGYIHLRFEGDGYGDSSSVWARVYSTCVGS